LRDCEMIEKKTNVAVTLKMILENDGIPHVDSESS
jgi:hypothetical protein